MNETAVALGRGVVKTIISVFVGTGVGLVTFGCCVKDTEDIWLKPGPPPAFFLAVGAGLLSAGVLMLALFFTPLMWKSPSQSLGKGHPIDL